MTDVVLQLEEVRRAAGKAKVADVRDKFAALGQHVICAANPAELQMLLQTVEEQVAGIRMLIDLVVQFDARIRKLELAENKRQRKLAIIKPE